MRYLFLLLLFSGCVSVEKAESVMRAHPKELAELCADCFPVKESEVKVDTTFIKGDVIIRTDTVNGDCPDGTVIKIPCPTCKESKPDTIIVNKEIKVRDTAKETVLENERDDYKNKYANMELSRDKWRKLAIWGWGILLALGIGVFLKWYIRNRTILRLK